MKVDPLKLADEIEREIKDCVWCRQFPQNKHNISGTHEQWMMVVETLRSARPEALRIDEDAIQQVMWAVFSYADRREAFAKLADEPHSPARDIAREAMRVQDEYIRGLLRKLASVPSALRRIPCTPCERIVDDVARCPDCPSRLPQGDADK